MFCFHSIGIFRFGFPLICLSSAKIGPHIGFGYVLMAVTGNYGDHTIARGTTSQPISVDFIFKFHIYQLNEPK